MAKRRLARGYLDDQPARERHIEASLPACKLSDQVAIELQALVERFQTL